MFELKNTDKQIFIRCALICHAYALVWGGLAISAFLFIRNPACLDALPWLIILPVLAAIVYFDFILALLFSLTRNFQLWNPIGSRLLRWTCGKTYRAVLLVGILGWAGLYTASWAARASEQRVNHAHLVVIGLDGADWRLLEPWFEQGELPNLRRMTENGASGVLESMPPMRSPSLWTTIATGLPPEEHGVEGFFSTRADLRALRVWDIAHADGIGIGLYNWLVTWPLMDPFDFVIPAWMARSPETSPPEYVSLQEILLEQSRDGGPWNPWTRLWDSLGHGARLDGIQRLAWFYVRDRFGLDEETRLAAKSIAEVRLQCDIFIALRRRYDPGVLAFTLYGSDKLAHRFWHHMAPEEFPGHDFTPNPAFAEVLLDYYREADRAIGRIMRGLPEDAYVALVSDHGMKADTALPGQFFLDVEALLRDIGFRGSAHHKSILRRIYFEPAGENRDSLNKLAEALKEIHWDETGEPLFQVVREAERLFIQPAFSLTAHPESPLARGDAIRLRDHGKKVSANRLFTARYFSGAHDPDGVIILLGPGTRNGKRLPDAHLLDVAPTLLRILGLPISDDLPGRVMVEAFTDEWLAENPEGRVDFYPALETLTRDAASPETEEFLERLRSRGYLR